MVFLEPLKSVRGQARFSMVEFQVDSDEKLDKLFLDYNRLKHY